MPTKQQASQAGQFSDADLAQPENVASSGGEQGTQEPSLMKQVGQSALDAFTGVGKGFASTANNLGKLVYPDAIAKHFTGTPSAEQQASYFAPNNTSEAVGKGLEQAGEFLIPGGAEEKAASLLPKGMQTLGRIGASGVGAGLVNKAQGGNFSTGAAAGAAGAGLGAGLKAAAPMVAESALGIPKAARAFGKTPGKAILEETRGIRPETIASSAKERLGQLNPELEAKYAASPNTASLKPSRDFLDQEMNKAVSQNARGLHGQLNNMANTLHENFATSQRIPQDIPPSDLLNLKRGFGEEHTSWNPEVSNRALGAGRHTYGLLDQAGDKAVPEGAELNQRISSLLPVAKRAESVSREPGAVGKTLGRFGRHTGALAVPIGLGGAGAGLGYREGGAPGAVAGAVTGMLAPELIASPEGQMATARLLGKANTLKPATGLLLQGTRGNQ